MKAAINRMSRFWVKRSLGLLILRVATGAVFLAHGWQKIHNLQGVAGMMLHLGVIAPVFFGSFIAWLEVIGGLALILGIASRFFALLLGIEMLEAIFLTGIGRGFQPHEFEIMLMAASFAIALIGSGRFSAFGMECKHCGGMLCGGGEDCPKRTAHHSL